ncbi:zinc ribbon domain-containing protein [Thermanaerothrix sp.]|jgi:hypothetical protein|uniref:zinc ribbon domain-containing protein n=1 Tax=Thermanaerothrix sp. TaxID=2972675 RepID=UPI002ADDD78D|nr:zinc ribbon domain-containing protein [Thermanaerothrix sp.]
MCKRLGLGALLVIIGLFIQAHHASAQNEITLASLEIDLWPEYDRPEMLVIYRLTLDNSVKLPAQLTLRIPAAVGSPYNVAYEDAADGMLYNLNYSTQTDGNWLRVSFTTPSPTLQVEYYDPGLKKEGALRTFEYLWPGDYAVKDLTVVVQQPPTATAWTLIPSMGSGVKGNDGLTYYHYAVGELKAGTSFVLRLRYEKANDDLSAPMQPVQPAAPIETAGSEQGGPWYTQVWVLVIAAGAVLILTGLLWWFALTRAPAQKRTDKRPRHAARMGVSPSSDASPLRGLYCPACGHRVQPEDRFCRTCGTRLQQG